MHDYLYNEHSYTKLEYDLESPDEIEELFLDVGADFLDCGQGFYTEKDTIHIFLNGKSYAVTITGTIGSQKQDRGDRLYYIDDIESVTYVEIPTPEPKERKNYSLDDLVNVTEDQYKQVLQSIATICK